MGLEINLNKPYLWEIVALFTVFFYGGKLLFLLKRRVFSKSESVKNAVGFHAHDNDCLCHSFDGSYTIVVILYVRYIINFELFLLTAF